ncbi:hypothetical protein [Acidovorax sp. SUPP3334]|uniref:hypothetical protein n=1 Tax=Acidovorax sp. SUPP3334 TaxID=2920881 RepID=UPI0023DE3199|nr:hypothetical protein [Acidovorax sp. SUPP3334]GKT23013.1 hypothetical protein AVHM3334_10265 [Acidovorax sp. SUPP3334]
MGYATSGAIPAISIDTASTTSASTQPVAQVSKKLAMLSRPLWEKLSVQERQQMEMGYELKLLEPESYGVILDVQGADQSTPGTNGGALLGGAIANAAYLDRAFSGNNNYSAGANLAIGLLGAALGSAAMDRAPTSQFQFRYTIRQGDGEIQYFDELKSTSFRHSVGVCVLLPSLNLVSQQICNQTSESIRARYFVQADKD